MLTTQWLSKKVLYLYLGRNSPELHQSVELSTNLCISVHSPANLCGRGADTDPAQPFLLGGGTSCRGVGWGTEDNCFSLDSITQRYMWDKTTQLQSKAELKFVTVDLLDHLQMHNHVFCNAEIALDILDLVLRQAPKTAQNNYLVADHAHGSWACWES